MPELSYYERTRIQMEYAVPFINALKEVIGEHTLMDALQQIHQRSIGNTDQRSVADLAQMDKMVDMFAEGGALKYDVIVSSNDAFAFNISQCAYAQMMEELGGREFGHLLLCGRDFADAKRLGLELERTQTRMQGGDYCDFRYRRATSED
ncbi:MAG: L-2-amino-thiazoline-4-carboxylic acid hydrolase [Pseudomonadota bacterium]